MKRLPTLTRSALLVAGLSAASVSAAELDITIENLTHGIYFTPFVVAAHPGSVAMFETGTMASPELQAIAEGGDTAGMLTALSGLPVLDNPAGGLLGPGATSTVATLDSGDMGYLSLASMLLPTNDGFVGLDRWMIPSEAGTYTVYLKAYDAGTEANDEIINGGAPGAPGIPADPSGTGGTGGSGIGATSTNSYVHIHPGNIGDDDPAGGASDLNNQTHRWLNPVAKLTVVVK